MTASIEMYCAGDCTHEGEPTQKGGCGIILVSTDKYGRTQHREFHYGLGNSNLDLAELQAVRLAMASVSPANRADKVTVTTNSVLVATILTDDADTDVIKGKQKIIAEVRKWYGFYKNIEIVVAAGNDRHMDRALELARKGLTTQSVFDTLTLPGDANVNPTR